MAFIFCTINSYRLNIAESHALNSVSVPFGFLILSELRIILQKSPKALAIKHSHVSDNSVCEFRYTEKTHPEFTTGIT